MPVPPVPETIAFETFVLDPKRRVLSAAGAPVDLHDRAFDMLLLLIERRAGPVSRDDIKKHVWKGLAVSDNNVTVQMSNLRRALEPHGGDGLIITVKDEGYRFVGDVIEPAQATSSPAGGAEFPSAMPPPFVTALTSTRGNRASAPLAQPEFKIGAAVAAIVAVLLIYVAAGRAGWFAPGPPRLSIAVLPFRNLTDNGTGNYMADAVTDDLTTDLAHIPGSAVTARGSAERFRSRNIAPASIGAALNVRYLVDGSLRVADRTALIDVALIDAPTGQELWSQHFETAVTGLAATQALIVNQIASELDVTLPEMVIQHERPDDADAQDLFYRGYTIMLRDDTPTGLARAEALLTQALRRRPDYLDAMAELALTLVLKAASGGDPTADADQDRARTLIAQALSAGQNAVALAADARLRQMGGDCDQAEASAGAALSLVPNNVDAMAVLAKCATDRGDLVHAEADIRSILQLNPDPDRRKPRLALLTQVLLLQGRYRDALAAGNSAIAGDTPPVPENNAMGRAEYVRWMIVAATVLNGDSAAASTMLQSYAAIWPHRSVWRIGAYSPRSIAALPGFGVFMGALVQAGMPMYADVARAVVSPYAGDDPGSGDFADPPPALTGVVIVDTARAAALAANGATVVIDFGHGAAAMSQAILAGPLSAGTITGESTWLPEPMRNRCAMPVMVLGDGVYGDAAPTAARVLVARGCQQVAWYQGGEEAWAAAHMPSADRRPRY